MPVKQNKSTGNNNKKKGAPSGGAGAGTGAGSKPAVTAEGLIAQGNKAMSKLQPELASNFFKRALALSPEDTNIMDALADTLMQLGDVGAALALLTQSTELNPHENPFKWLFLAQLQDGCAALETYNRAIDILNEVLVANKDPATMETVFKQIVKAHTSIAELFLTDLCYDENAEVQCETAISTALGMDPHSLDALQALVSLRLSQSRVDDAIPVVRAVFGRIKAFRDKARARTVLEELAGTAEEAEGEDNPEPEFCIATAKLLIECGAKAYDLIEAAMELLTDLMHDDDENIELWYLMGVASLSLNPPDLENAKYHLEIAKEMMDKLRENCDENEFPFNEQYQLLIEHLAMIGSIDPSTVEADRGAAKASSSSMAIDGADDHDEGAEEEEEWSTCDEDEEVDPSAMES